MISLCLKMPHQSSFFVRTDMASVADSLRQKYGIFAVTGETDADYAIDVAQADADGFCVVTAGGESVRTHNPLRVIDDFIFDHTKYAENIFALHGAAVEHAGRVWVFLASSMTGKTTLTAYLTAQGFGYLTDDCILLHRDTCRVTPCPTPLHIRDGGLEVLKRYESVPEGLQILSEGEYTRYVVTPVNRVREDLPLGGIFFISRTGDTNALSGMPANERIMELMKAPITHYKPSADYLRFLSRLAIQGNCRRLVYHDMAYVAEVLRRG